MAWGRSHCPHFLRQGGWVPESISHLPTATEPSWHLQKPKPRALECQFRVLLPTSLEVLKGFPKGSKKRSSYTCVLGRMLSWQHFWLSFISGIPLSTLSDSWYVFTPFIQIIFLFRALPCLLSSIDSAAFLGLPYRTQISALLRSLLMIS